MKVFCKYCKYLEYDGSEQALFFGKDFSCAHPTNEMTEITTTWYQQTSYKRKKFHPGEKNEKNNCELFERKV